MREEDAPEEKLRAENLIRESLGKVMEIEKKLTSLYNILQVARDTVDVIEREKAFENKILINTSGGRKPQALRALFGAYARHSMIEKIVYITEEDNEILELPILSFPILETKKMILFEIEKGEKYVPSLAKRVGISRGMAYNHVKDLKDADYITEELEITTAGRLAIL
ncbi:MAG: CRISPR-associated CARF protein Csa3 [Methanosarcinales archaeon]